MKADEGDEGDEGDVDEFAMGVLFLWQGEVATVVMKVMRRQELKRITKMLFGERSTCQQKNPFRGACMC